MSNEKKAPNLHNVEFLRSAVKESDFPFDSLPQIVFAGKSNVGKSSVINKLLNRKNFARVSAQPGKTIHINYFTIDKQLYFVDLPGYGYARVSMAERQRWANLISGYFAQERSFNLVIALVDVRLEAQKLDQDMLAFLRENNLPFVVALTKADKLSRPKQTRQVELLSRQLEVPHEQMLLTSAQTGLGIDELRHRIEKACD